jgi:hypothetical protein
MASLVLPQPEKRALGRDTADGKSNLVEEPPTGWEADGFDKDCGGMMTE